MSQISRTSLPIELWLAIIAAGTLNQRDRHSLTLVSREFNSIFTFLLYSDLTIDLNPTKPSSTSTTPTASKFQTLGLPQQCLLECLESSATHRSYIHNINILNKEDPNRWWDVQSPYKEIQHLNPDVLAIILDCPNLRSVYFHNISLTTNDICHLAARPSPGLSIAIEKCRVSGEQLPNTLFTATALHCPEKIVLELYPLIYGGSLERLKVTGGPWEPLSLARTDTTSIPSLTLLTHLEVPYIRNDIIHFFTAAPNVTSLNIQAVDDPVKFTDNEDWRRVLPKLESITCPSQILPLLITGRPVTSLKSWDLVYGAYANFDFSSAEDNFGSLTPILSIQWLECRNLGVLLNYIADKCPSVEEFEFFGLVTRLAQDEMKGHLKQVKKLKHLQRLGINHRVSGGPRPPTEEESLWEEAQCKNIRTEGCPDIYFISFPSSLIWTRHPEDDNWKSTLPPMEDAGPSDEIEWD